VITIKKVKPNAEAHMCGHDTLDWKDIGLAGSLVEEMAAGERERQWLLEQVRPAEEEDSDRGL
jgi:hypothetical protein